TAWPDHTHPPTWGYFFLPQGAASFGAVLCLAPFWPSIRTWALPAAFPHSEVLFSSRLFLPPFIRRTKELIGASGIVSNVVRIPWLCESIRPSRSMLI